MNKRLQILSKRIYMYIHNTKQLHIHRFREETKHDIFALCYEYRCKQHVDATLFK